MPSPTSAAVVAACRALTGALPASLDKGVDRRPVTGGADLTAAWGDPPVTLRCGVPAGDPTRTPLVIDGVSLVTQKRGGTVTYTTVGRSVSAEVVIPASYEDQAYLVQPLLPALRGLPR